MRAASPRRRHFGSVKTFWMIACRPETMSILPLRLVCGCGGDLAQLQARAGDNLSGFIFGTGEPAQVIFSLKHLPKRIPRLHPKGFKEIWRKFAHILKHSGAMPADHLEIGNGSATNSESTGHEANVQRSEPNWQLINHIIRLWMKTFRD